MITINADDWGRSEAETDAALSCYVNGRISSVSAMVFMEDSERAAELAKGNGLDVGLHLNFSQRYNGAVRTPWIAEVQSRIVRFMSISKYAVVMYRPDLRNCFRDVYRTQADEFFRLYGKPPSHADGHQHRHLCANLLIDDIIPRGQVVRRNFSFWPGEKSLLNRTYRRLLDWRLARRYRLADFFFSLGQCLKANRLGRVAELARRHSVELMTHPVNRQEYAYLNSPEHSKTMSGIDLAPFTALQSQPELRIEDPVL